MPDGVVVRRIELPHRGEHVIKVHLEPLPTDRILPFIDWATTQLEGLIVPVTYDSGVKIMPSGNVHVTFSRQKGDSVVTAPLLRRVDRETLVAILRPRYTSELTVVNAYVIRGADERHRGTVIDLSHLDGEPFNPELVESVRQLDCVQGATLNSETCRVTMANPPALNDEGGRITAVIKAVAEVLGSEFEERAVPVDDNAHLALLREFDYQPSKKVRKGAGG